MERRARDIMRTPPVNVRAGSDLETAARLMLDHRVGSLLVVGEDGRLTGIVTDSDFSAKEGGIPFSTLRLPRLLGHWIGVEGPEPIYEEARGMSVDEVMSSPVHTVEEDDPVARVLEVMLERDVKHVPVVRGGEPVGMITRHDLLRLVVGPEE